MKLPNSVQTATKPWMVESIKYVNGSHLGSTEDLIREPYGKYAGSSAMGLSIGFKHHSSQPNFARQMAYDVNPTIIGDTIYVRTANVLRGFSFKDVEKYGIPLFIEDIGHDDWVNSTVGSKAIEYATIPKASEGLLRLPEIREHGYGKFDMTEVGLYTSKVIPFGAMRANDFGKELSKLSNEENRFRNFLFYNDLFDRPYDPEIGYHPFNSRSLDFVKKLIQEGIDEPRELEAFGTGDLSHARALAATYFRKFLVVDKGLHQRISEEAEALGFKGAQAREYIQRRYNSVMEHEYYHFHEPDILAESETENRIASIHEEHYAEGDEDIDAILSQIYAEYGEQWRSGASKSRYYSDLERLVDDGGEADENSVDYAKGASEKSGNYTNLRVIDSKTGEVKDYSRETFKGKANEDYDDIAYEETEQEVSKHSAEHEDMAETDDSAEAANDNTPQEEAA